MRRTRLLLIVPLFLPLLACSHSKKAPATPTEAQRDSGALPGQPHAKADVTVTANTNDDLSWMRPVYFEFDQADLLPGTRDTLVKLNDWMTSHPKVALTIEGHCDEQGTSEYNVALGQRRAQALVNYLTQLGTSGSRLKAVSWGSERPAADGHDEVAYAKNRRGEFVVAP